MTSPPDSAATARLHPAVIVVWAWKFLLSLAVLLLVSGLLWALLAAGRLTWVSLGLLTVVMGVHGLRYLRFRWGVEAEAVVIEQGLLLRKRRIIPRDRIQSVDLRRGILHRLLGVVEVRIEAIGGMDTQGRLDALSPDVAAELRRSLLAQRDDPLRSPSSARPEPDAPMPSSAPGAPPRPPDAPGAVPAPAPPQEDEVWATVGPWKLVLAGVTGGRVGVMAALIGFFFQLVPEEGWAGLVGRVMEQAPDPTTAAGIRVLAVIAFVVLFFSFVLSVAASVTAHWGFTLSASGRSLSVRRGLLTEHHDAVPMGRIQAVRIEENLARRMLGLASVHALVAGRPVGSDTDPGSGLLLPIATRAEAWHIARRAVGLDEDAGAPKLTPMPRRALRRRIARAVAAAMAAAGMALAVFGSGALAGAPGPAPILVAGGATLVAALALAYAAYGGLGWTDLDGYVAVREGVFRRRTTLVPVDRLQAVETTESPFQRLAGLTTVHLRVARAIFDPSPRALDMARSDARAWREQLARGVARGVLAAPAAAPSRALAPRPADP